MFLFPFVRCPWSSNCASKSHFLHRKPSQTYNDKTCNLALEDFLCAQPKDPSASIIASVPRSPGRYRGFRNIYSAKEAGRALFVANSTLAMAQETPTNQLSPQSMMYRSRHLQSMGPHTDALNPVTQAQIATAGREYLEAHIGPNFKTRTHNWSAEPIAYNLECAVLSCATQTAQKHLLQMKAWLIRKWSQNS